MRRIALFAAIGCGCSFQTEGTYETDTDTDSDSESSGYEEGTGSTSLPAPTTSSSTSSATNTTTSDSGSGESTGSTVGDTSLETGTETDESSSGGPPSCDLLFDFGGACTDSPDGMAVIAGSSFAMGCDIASEQPDCQPDEFPVHTVSLSTFAIDLTEVTVSAYQDCVDSGTCTSRSLGDGCNPEGSDRGGHPANCLDWYQAKTYCEWASKRLPTEAEWEYVSEGTMGNRWPWADAPNPNCDYAVVVDGGIGCGTASTFPVGSKTLGDTPAGVHDIVGNVQEWVADWYAPDAYGFHSASNPAGPVSGEFKILRGSSYISGAVTSHRIRNRWPADPGIPNDTVGFRCAVESQE